MIIILKMNPDVNTHAELVARTRLLRKRAYRRHGQQAKRDYRTEPHGCRACEAEGTFLDPTTHVTSQVAASTPLRATSRAERMARSMVMTSDERPKKVNPRAA